MTSRPYFVGITGGSGSGKTFFLKKLAEALGEENVCMVSHDHYYKERELQPKDENNVENFDTPESVDLDRFAKDLQRIKAGETIQIQEYTFNKKDAIPGIVTFEPRPIVIVEGIFVFHHQAVQDVFDLKLFVEAKPHVKIRRRIMRDSVERGYDLTDVLYRYEKHVMPAYEKYISAHKNNVDLIICNDHGCEQALGVITAYLKERILGKKEQA